MKGRTEMGIDYTKRAPQPPAASAGTDGSAPAGGVSGGGVSLSKVRLTKAAPTVSLAKHGSGGMLRVNLNWNARPPAKGGGLFKRLTAALDTQAIDLDLGCLWEFTDGSKGVVQALGNSFTAAPKGVGEPVIWLDGDDRSGTNSAGENLFVNLAHVASIRRILVFAFIYEGVPNWAAADGVVTLFPVSGPQIEVLLDEPRSGARSCAIAMLTSDGGELSVRREVNYVDGSQSALDAAYQWGLRWAPGRK
jgi:tellurite resistance protein TerA